MPRRYYVVIVLNTVSLLSMIGKLDNLVDIGAILFVNYVRFLYCILLLLYSCYYASWTNVCKKINKIMFAKKRYKGGEGDNYCGHFEGMLLFEHTETNNKLVKVRKPYFDSLSLKFSSIYLILGSYYFK